MIAKFYELPVLALTDFFLFSDLKTMCAEKIFSNNEEVIVEIKTFFNNRGQIILQFATNGVSTLNSKIEVCYKNRCSYLK